jgi:hypothetical protein
MLKFVFPALIGLCWFTPVIAQDDYSPGYRASYKVTFEADWSEETHPQDFPSNPHFSGLVGATHDQEGRLWKPGELATPGIESMAETGAKSTLLNEVDDLIAEGTARSALSGGGIGVSPGVVSLEFEISQPFPLVSLTSMIAPSPDWFVGVDSLSLRSGGRWLNEVVVELPPYDAGTDSGSTYNSANRATNPPEPIFLIEESPVGNGVPIGRFRFELVEAEGLFPISGYQSGWYYVPSRSGEGINFNVAQNGDRLFISVAWFTYSMGEQMWLIGSVDIDEGDEMATVELYRTSGTGFGDAFNADDVILDLWGTLTITVPDCGLLFVEWGGGQEFGTGQLLMEQLVNVAGLECE